MKRYLFIVISLVMMIKPNSKPQAEFLASSEKEVLYGGAAGGGKTWSLIVEPLRYVKDYPNYTGIIFRNTFPELIRSVIPLAKSYYKDYGADWSGSEWKFTFPSGATVHCGYMNHEGDWENYKGAGFCYMGFDELTTFRENNYVGVLPWNRSIQRGVRAYRRATSNPGGVGHVWVKKRFVDTCPQVKAGPRQYSKLADMWWQPYKSGETYWYRPPGSSILMSRKFIPARVFDNTDLLETNPDYLAELLDKPRRTVRALLEGDWDAYEGQFFTFNRATQVIPPFVIPPEWRLIGSLDPGYRNPCSFSLGAVDFDGNYYRVATYYKSERSPKEHAEGIKDFLFSNSSILAKITRNKKPDEIYADPSAWAKKDKWAVVASDKTFADIFADYGLMLTEALNDRISGWWAMKDLMTRVNDDGTPKYMVFDHFNVPYLDELAAAVSDDKDTEDILGKGRDPSVPDHALDEERYRILQVYAPRVKKDSGLPKWARERNKRIRKREKDFMIS
jgi:hypothetical protein